MALTYDELIAMGLSEDEARAIAVNTENTTGVGGRPFPQIKINYDSDVAPVGAFVYDVKKDKDGNVISVGEVFEKGIEFIPIAFKGQYSKFDSPIISNIFNSRDAKEAYDLKTGTPIRKLREKDSKIKYSKIIVGLLKVEKEYKPMFMYLSGAACYAFNEVVPEDVVVKNKIKISGTQKKKNGSVTYYIPTGIEVIPLSKDEIMQNIHQVAEMSKKFNAWVSSVNSTGVPRATTSSIASVAENDDICWE